ncbi:hypothetical protein KFE25_013742 [Diacronema lutheri]|uniref:Peptidyl-prolyl cis-trans isomerase n=2 Tax=Diacronema lutheri TaxID=2081491 RepID=A0A8J5XQV0_DIALT|nr:hypothetical protein KFE25_013742 [Diacronema lutheri]
MVVALAALVLTAPQMVPTVRVAPRLSRSVASTRAGVSASAIDRRQASTVAAALVLGCSLLPAGVVAAPAAVPAPRVAIETTAGTMEFELWPEVAPKTVDNFVKLANNGFFDGQCFHRVIAGFVIQGGDPNSKKGYGPSGTFENADMAAVRTWGRGGPGYTVDGEFNPRKHEFGVLSMARSASPNSAGSQFFVCLGNLPSLDNQYTTFGRMTSGENVLRALGSAKTVRGDFPEIRQGITSIRVL